MPRPGGFTLFELLAVLIIITLAFALAAPTLIPNRASASDDSQAVITQALRNAVRRGESVTVQLNADSSLRVHVSALGACTLETSAESASRLRIDPVTCRLSSR
jgi:prepilin-type N-terminal cleavage/methylation domain-containing protein